MSYLMVAGGLVLLTLCGDFLVRGAAALSLKLHIPPLIVGLTVIAFGTSAPELFVSVGAALGGYPGIAMGNVIGSNIANVLLVLGVPALIMPIACHQAGVTANALVMLAASLLLIALAFTGAIGLWQGLVLLLAMTAFVGWTIATSLAHRREKKAALANGNAKDELGDDVDPDSLPQGWPKIWALTLAGLIGLPIGAELLVTGAADIARAFGMSDAVIGLTLVAVGTSLPEFAATLISAIKRHTEMAIGNVIGSNIFNILLILGTAGVAAPLGGKDIPVTPEMLTIDLWVMLGAALIVVGAVLIRRPIGRVAGVGMSAVYAAYVWFLLATGGMT
ncbi:calcium/sodium antiporter [Futiania mangrovi]|uniref:Calcium/sodium antiporter n=1 Tax=Futiania mangrovi TaxID=2959716 RepID=A0A9J6PHZ1_9PROT|nr:calcium/sodium antiporter [Futiania mangrovii]MCP1337432.1 calcium/sodium antiporter [Futiania mangrovii]